MVYPMDSDLGRTLSDGKKIAFRNILLQTKQSPLLRHTHTHIPSHCPVLSLVIDLLFIGIHLLKLFLRYSNIRNKTEVLGQLINLIDLRFENGNLDKEDDSITPQRGNSQKIFSIILRRI